jgi:hypothetical protein
MRYFYDIQGVLEWVQDSMKKGNRELQEKLMLLQKEKDQVLLFIMFITLQIDVNDIAKTH